MNEWEKGSVQCALWYWSASFCRLARGMGVRHPLQRRPGAWSLRLPDAAGGCVRTRLLSHDAVIRLMVPSFDVSEATSRWIQVPSIDGLYMIPRVTLETYIDRTHEIRRVDSHDNSWLLDAA